MASLSSQTLYEQIAHMTGIPVEEMTDADALMERLPAMRATLNQHLVGQNAAVEEIIKALRARLLRQTARRPLLALLCVGPSGVGKTQTALNLARFVLGDASAVHRFDGSEYSEDHAIAKLVGSPPGYIGSGSGGTLTEAVRRRPRAVVLFDEIEKASAPVRQVLLQILDAGRLTDASGQTVNCKRTMFICTSNLGNKTEAIVPDPHVYETRVRAAVAQELPPELVGRFDAVVVYRHLNQEALQSIVRLELDKMADELRAVNSIVASDAAVAALAQESETPNAGAREIERVIRRRLDLALEEMLQRGILSSKDPASIGLHYDQHEYIVRQL